MRDSQLLIGHWSATVFLPLVQVEPRPLLDHSYNVFMFSRHHEPLTCPRCFSCHIQLKLMKLSILWGIRIYASTTVGELRPGQHRAVKRKTTYSLEITVRSHIRGSLVAALSSSSCLLSSRFICLIRIERQSSPSPKILIVSCLQYHSSTAGSPAGTLSQVPHSP